MNDNWSTEEHRWIRRNSAYLENNDPADSCEYIEGSVFVGMAFDGAREILYVYQEVRRICTKVRLEALQVDDQPALVSSLSRIRREIEGQSTSIFSSCGAAKRIL